jgi:hypothetical protein
MRFSLHKKYILRKMERPGRLSASWSVRNYLVLNGHRMDLVGGSEFNIPDEIILNGTRSLLAT